MKKILILAFASVIGGTAFAQTSSSTASSGLRYGLKAGVNLPKYQFQNEGGTDPETKTTTNFHVTGYLDAPLGAMFSIQPGISLQGKGGQFEDTQVGGTQFKSEQNSLWVEVPVNFVANFPIVSGTKLYLGAGPYAGFGVSGENKVTIGNTVTTNDINYGSDSSDDLKGIDIGLNFLGGVQLNNGFNIGAGYGLGLTDLRPTADGGNGKQTNRVWSFSLGYAF